ncbi:transglutaminase domain-containing protein [Polaribacter sp. R77954]|uniref:transglutaminase domain-containing protein n=1 Tax=Polaribacter sp. R77954 TaxID=3093870 RepID=UPI0037C8D88B
MLKKIIGTLILFVSISLYTQSYKFGEISKKELEENFYPQDSGAAAVYLYKKRTTYMRLNVLETNCYTDVHERIKIYNKDGLDEANRIINYYNLNSRIEESVSAIKGATYYLENDQIKSIELSKTNIFKDKLNNYLNSIKIAFPKVKAGAIIEIKYRIRSQNISYIRPFEFQYAIPIKKIEYSFEAPEYFDYNKISKGYYAPPLQASKKVRDLLYNYDLNINYNINVFSFKDDNIPAIKNDELYTKNIDDYRGAIRFDLKLKSGKKIPGVLKKDYTTWNDIGTIISKSNNFSNQINKSSYYKKDLEILVSKAKTDEAKITAIFQFVKNRIKWNSYDDIYAEHGVKKAYKERVGNVADINFVLISMLRSAGLNANPILVSTKKNGYPIFPSRFSFNYVICKVDLEGKRILLDATDQYNSINLISSRILNWRGRVVEKDGSSYWEELTPDNYALESNTLFVKIDAKNTLVKGKIRTKYENLKALNFRKTKNHINNNMLISDYETKNNIEIESFSLQNQLAANLPIYSTIDLTGYNFIEKIKGKLYIEPLLFLKTKVNPFKADKRVYPVEFDAPWTKINRVSLEIPKGYTLEKMPSALKIALPNNLGFFTYEVTQFGNKIKVLSSLQINNTMISVDNYIFLKDFYNQLVQKESEKMILKKI